MMLVKINRVNTYLMLMDKANNASADASSLDRSGNHCLARLRRQDARALRAWASQAFRML